LDIPAEKIIDETFTVENFSVKVKKPKGKNVLTVTKVVDHQDKTDKTEVKVAKSS